MRSPNPPNLDQVTMGSNMAFLLCRAVTETHADARDSLRQYGASGFRVPVGFGAVVNQGLDITNIGFREWLFPLRVSLQQESR